MQSVCSSWRSIEGVPGDATEGDQAAAVAEEEYQEDTGVAEWASRAEGKGQYFFQDFHWKFFLTDFDDLEDWSSDSRDDVTNGI